MILDGFEPLQMSEEEYRGDPAVNKSTLWEMRRSPAHYMYALTHPREDTAAFKLGRAAHMAILQPVEFREHYVLEPVADKRTKEGKQIWADFMAQMRDGQEIISEQDYWDVMGMYDSVYMDVNASAWLDGAITEVPLFWTDESTGIQCKCRLDAMTERDGQIILMDLKTCADASTGTFLREALRYGYDVQAAHYIRGVKNEFPDAHVQWYFICVEKKAPYAVNVIHVSEDFIDRGTLQLIGLMDKLKTCTTTGEWPGYGFNELVLPPWAEIPEDE